MAGPGRTRGRLDEPWERVLYLLLVIVAVVVILYSLFGIATLLGYLPVSQSGGDRKQVQHPAVSDRIKERMPLADRGESACLRRANAKVVALAPSPSSSALAQKMAAPCAEVEADRVASPKAAATGRSYGR
jgi:hypothetical protein